jgi:hypothetical protein
MAIELRICGSSETVEGQIVGPDIAADDDHSPDFNAASILITTLLRRARTNEGLGATWEVRLEPSYNALYPWNRFIPGAVTLEKPQISQLPIRGIHSYYGSILTPISALLKDVACES